MHTHFVANEEQNRVSSLRIQNGCCAFYNDFSCGGLLFKHKAGIVRYSHSPPQICQCSANVKLMGVGK